MPSYDAIILGAGAAGLMCAMEAGKRGRRVVVLDRAEVIGRKILISGGGRCNFTNLHCKPENFLSTNPHFCKSALAGYPPAEFIRLVEKHGIAYHEKTLGQLFCDRSARQIVTMLEEECRLAGVEIRTHAEIGQVRQTSGSRDIPAAGFSLSLRIGGATDSVEFQAPALVVATGGLSIPKMGATAFGYDLARQFGLKIQDCRPALVPLTFDSADRRRWCDLAGLATEVVVSSGAAPAKKRGPATAFREKMLITHRGLSGPAILQISSYWRKGASILLDIAPGWDVTRSLRAHSAGRDSSAAFTALHQVLPNRLAERWLYLYPPPDWSNRGLEEMERQLHGWQITPEGTEGYEKAEVTAGGVDTDELSAQTMMSRRVPGLYFIGEVVDVTGHLGGFNFQWAWASGAAAGRVL